MINLMLAEDHKIFMEGLKCLLHEAHDISIVSEVSNDAQLLSALPELKVDVLVMGIHMHSMDAIEVTRKIALKYKDIRILAFSMLDHPVYLRQMLKAGALGYITTQAGKEEMLYAIRESAKGNCFISPAIFTKMEKDEISYGSIPENILTLREIEVLELMAEGLTNEEIGKKIHLSKRTVETHRQNLIIKTNSKNSFELLKFGIFSGIIRM